MNRYPSGLRVWLGAALLLSATQVAAFELSGYRWRNPTAAFHVGLPGTSPNGTLWRDALTTALNTWSDATAFEWTVVGAYEDPCNGRRFGGTGNSRAGADFGTDVCGTEFGRNVLAITRTFGVCFATGCSSGFYITDADIVFNANENWEVYNGRRRNGQIDFGRVALHELGHAIGLQHEDSRAAIMQSFVSDIDSLQADDIAGVQAIYAPETITLPRDDQLGGRLPTRYGIDVILPADTRLPGPTHSIALNGALETADGRLDGKPIDVFQFTLLQDSTLNLSLDSSAFNAVLHVVRIDSTQQPIPGQTYSDDNNGGGTNARLVSVPAPAGTYWIGVTPLTGNEGGAYELRLSTATIAALAPPVRRPTPYGVSVQVNPNPLIVGELAPGDDRLGNGNPVDLYEFSVTANTVLEIDLQSAQFDAQLYLARLAPNGELDLATLVSDDNGGTGTNARLLVAVGPGTWWLAASSVSATAVGQYQVEVRVVP